MKKMKKIVNGFVALLLCIGIANSVQAQGACEPGKVYIDLGVGFPRYSIVNNWLYTSYGYNYHRLPALRANFEIGFNEFISGGAYFGYTEYGWKHTTSLGYIDEEKNQYYTFGFRGTFHIWDFLNDQLDLGLGVEKLDLYVSIMTGARLHVYSDIEPHERDTDKDVDFYFGPTFGARYYFVRSMSVFIEAGYGSMSYGLIGLGFKL